MSYPIGRFCAAAALSVTAYVRGAHALQLMWQAPPGCPNAEAVLRETRRLAGANQGEALEAQVVVTQIADQRWRVVIGLSGSATGHRTLTADSCSQLARASSLIIALAANPDAALDLPGDESTVVGKPLPTDGHGHPADPLSESTPPPSPGLATVPSAPQSPSRSLPPTPRAVAPLELLSRGGLEWGALPTSTGFLGLGARVRTVDDSVSLALTMHATQGTSATFTNGIGANFRVVAAQVRACVESGASRLRIASCGGMQLSMVRASAFVQNSTFEASGYADAVTYSLYRWIPGALLGINPRFEFAPKFTAELGADLVIPTTHWQFVIDNMATLFRPAELQYQLSLGLAYQLN